MGNSETNFDQDGSNNKLARMSQIFQLLGTDCKKNINIIVEQACQILNGVFSFHNRIDDEQKSLIIWSSHNRPQDIETCFDKEGHICWEATIKGQNKPISLPNLEDTPYFTTDPYVKKYNLKSYLGFPIRLNETTIGSLCIVDTKKRQFSNDDVHIIQMLAAALSLEEERLSEKERYQILVESANDAIFIIQDDQFKFANPRALGLTGYDLNSIDKRGFLKLVHPKDRPLLKQNCNRRVKNEDFQSTYSFRLIDKSKKTIWVQINAVRIIWEGQPAVEQV